MQNRLEELDILRGLSVIGMILVITPGDWGYRLPCLNHAVWEGFPLADTISPTFLFCVGFSLAISFTKKHNNGDTALLISKHIFRRTTLLILIGLFIAAYPWFDFSSIRIPGVLQRIGLCYFIVGLLLVLLKEQKTEKKIAILLGIAAAILILYWVLLFYVPVPGFESPGFDSPGSWAPYIDRKVFGPHHLWAFGIVDGVRASDPDGLLSALPASVNVILGVILGFLYLIKSKYFKVHLLFIAGLILSLIGLLLGYTGIVPIIKTIWTSSFALLSSGVSIMVLALISLGLKFKYVPSLFYPTKVFGANALLAFIIALMSPALFLDIPYFEKGSQLLSLRTFGFEAIKTVFPNPYFAAFLFSVFFLTFVFFTLWFLYRRKYFIKL